MAIEKIDNYAIHENPSTNTNSFDIENYLNVNWRKTKQVINNNADELTKSIEKIKLLEEDNTINKEDIKNIKAKDTKQDTDIENIKKENIELKEENIRIKNDLKSSVLTGQVKAENIVLNDSSNARLMKLEIGGNHKQETRTGKNLYNAGKLIDDYFVTAGAKGNTITQYEAKDYVICKIDKGVMTVEKYNTSGYNWIAKWIEIDKNTDYTISLDKSTTSVSFVGFSTKENKTEGVIIAELNGSKKEVSFNSGDYAYYAVSFYPNQGFEIAIQIEKGKQKTAFEEYGAMPSIEFPSEVRAVENKVNVVISNKNFLKITKTSVTSNGVTTTHSDNKIVSKGTVSLNWFNIISWEKCFIPANTYTISYNKTIQGRLVAKFKYADKRIKDVYINPSHKKISFTLEKDTVEFTLNIDQLTANDNVNFETNIQIEQGTVATEIVSHEEQNYIIPVQEKLYKVGNHKDRFIKLEGKWYEQHNIKKLILNGNEEWIKSTNYPRAYYLYHKNVEKAPISNTQILCNYAKGVLYNGNNYNEGVCTNDVNSFGFRLKDTSEILTVEDWKKLLKEKFDTENPVCIYYLLANAMLIECTEEQKKVLEQIEKEAHTYKNITHIYSTDEIGLILDAEYIKDLDTVLNNLANASLVGGN